MNSLGQLHIVYIIGEEGKSQCTSEFVLKGFLMFPLGAGIKKKKSPSKQVCFLSN